MHPLQKDRQHYASSYKETGSCNCELRQHTDGQLRAVQNLQHHLFVLLTAIFQVWLQDFCVSFQAVSKWETGKCMPDISLLENLCIELDISIKCYCR